MRLHHILDNFNTLLMRRGINVPLYNSLLKLSDMELRTWLEDKEANPETEILRTFTDNPESNLSVIIKTKGVNIIIYWSQTTGKTFTVSEMTMLEKAKFKFHAKYIFVMCLYDKVLQNPQLPKNIEIFNYNDVLSDPFGMTFGVSGVIVQSYDDWLSENIMLKNTIIPTCYLNDPLAKYVGARAGNVLTIRRPSLLPTMLQAEELTFRMVTGILNKEMAHSTGEYYR